MFETLLIPTAIPHRCSLSSFIGLHFNLFFSFSFSNTSFIMSTPWPHPFCFHSLFSFRFSKTTQRLLINSPNPAPVCFNLLQAKLSLTLVYKPMLLIGHQCSSWWWSTSVPGMTPAHCGHLEAQMDEYSSDRKPFAAEVQHNVSQECLILDSPQLIIISVSLQGWRLNHRFEEKQILFWFLGTGLTWSTV